MTDEITSAESLLREIATDLVGVPLDERARGLHLKALGLKRVVAAWTGGPGRAEHGEQAEQLRATLDSLRSLHAEVREVRSSSEVRLRSTDRPSYRPSYRPGKMR